MINMRQTTEGITKLQGEYTSRLQGAQERQQRLFAILTELLPAFGPNWHRHSLVGLKVEALARVTYYSELYSKIANVPGIICEFGVQWGATIAQLINLRSIYEPFNISLAE
jgi:hypothetical protein